MTSYSSDRRAPAGYAWRAVAMARMAGMVGMAGMMAAVALGGCHGQPVQVTEASFTHRGICEGPGGASVGNMDGYIVQMYEFNDPAAANPQDRSSCARCVASPDVCHLERETCLCGNDTPATDVNLATSLRGFGLEGIDANYPYCLRVIALDLGTLALSSDAASDSLCSCDATWTTADFLTSSAQLCATTTAPFSAGPLQFMLNVVCPGDGSVGQGPPGQGASGQAFNQCLFPPS
jgi:hypothetical protein